MAGQGYRLFNTGDVLTAAQVNTYLQEQVVMVFASAAARTTALSGVLAEGMMSYLTDTDVIQYYNGTSWVTVNTDQTPLTTKGDLFTFSTVDARLGVGANGTVLTADSSQTTGLSWLTTPAFLARINTNQSINSSTITKIAFDTETIDNVNGYDPTTNYRFTVPTGQGGNYLIGFDLAWGVYSVGHQTIMYIYKNGSAYGSPAFPWRDSGSDVVSTSYSKIVALDAGDYVEAYAQHNRGVAATLYSPNASFWGHKI